MRTFATRLCVFALAFGMTVSLATVNAFPPPKKEKKDAAKPKEQTAEEVQKLLGENVKCAFLDIEMRSALSDLSAQTGVKIKFDHAFLAQQPGDQEQITVTLQTEGMPLRKALRKITEAFQMHFGIVGDTVWISTEEGLAARQLRQYIPMSCKETPLTEVVSNLSRKYAVSMVVDAKAKKTKAADTPITLELEEATLETVLRLSTEMAGLKPVRIGSVIYITSEDRADKLRDSDNLVPAIPLVPDRDNLNQPMPQPALGGPAPQQIPPAGGAPNAETPPADPQKDR